MKQFNISYAQEQNKPVHAIVQTTDGSDCKNIVAIQWNRTSESLPKKNPNVRYDVTWCLCITGPFSIEILAYNHQDDCWDDEDDYVYDRDKVTFWALLPEIPHLDTMKLSSNS